MSFVSIILCNNFLSVMADSRASEIYKDGSFHKVISEDDDKIRNFSDSTFYVITGILQYALDFIEKSNMNNLIINNGKLKSSDDIEKWYNDSLNLLNYDYSFGLSFGGISVDNKLRFYSIESDKKNLVEHNCNQNLVYDLSSSQYVSTEWVTQQFIDLYKIYDGTSSSMLKVQGILNDLVSDIDPTVNKNKKYFLLQL